MQVTREQGWGRKSLLSSLDSLPIPRAARPHTALQIHLQSADVRHWSDRIRSTGQAGAEGELHRLRANDGPARAVVEQCPVGLLGAEGRLAGNPRDGTEALLMVQLITFSF